MNIVEADYRISKNDKFIIESSISVSLWDANLINNFHENLNNILNEIYVKSNSTFYNSKS